MNDYERISSFVRSMAKEDEGELRELYRDAVRRGVPVIRPEARELLKTQLMIKKPKGVLEIGTAVGYSSIYMTGFLPAESKITTLELSEERTAEARANIEHFGRQSQIEVICGDAAETLKTLPDAAYEFAFVDAAKAQYIYYLPEVLRVLKPGSVILSDNILQEGEVLESHFLVEKRNRTIHDRMREYLYVITHDARLETAILPVGDGMAISVVREESNSKNAMHNDDK